MGCITLALELGIFFLRVETVAVNAVFGLVQVLFDILNGCHIKAIS